MIVTSNSSETTCSKAVKMKPDKRWACSVSEEAEWLLASVLVIAKICLRNYWFSSPATANFGFYNGKKLVGYSMGWNAPESYFAAFGHG